MVFALHLVFATGSAVHVDANNDVVGAGLFDLCVVLCIPHGHYPLGDHVFVCVDMSDYVCGAVCIYIASPVDEIETCDENRIVNES